MKDSNPKLVRGVIQVLTLAFEKNKSVLHVAGSGPGSVVKRSRLMRYALRRCDAFGKVVDSADGKAVALVLFPDQVRFSFAALYWDLQLIFGVIGLSKLFSVMRKEALLRRLRPEGKLYYLWFIGVDPDAQGQGLGGELLDRLCADAAMMGRTICLETSTAENLPWYSSHGFELYHQLGSGDYPLYFFKRQI